jgi:hypothetical protein
VDGDEKDEEDEDPADEGWTTRTKFEKRPEEEFGERQSVAARPRWVVMTELKTGGGEPDV